MYNEYFGFEEPPFSIAPDPRYLYMSEHHREALAHLLFGFNSDGGFVLLTGEVGTGKTTVCRCLLEQIPGNSAIAFILNPKLTVEELLATICDEFSINYPKNNNSVKIFIDLINSYLLDAHTKGRKAVLIIDEAQNLSSDVLEQLRLLTNLETNQYKLLQIILLGQPELRDKLSKPELRQLSQRIIARYHLDSLSRKDIGAYVSHRLSVSGQKKQLFPDATINKLYNLTGGVPRLINVICDRALLGTYTQGKEIVSKSFLARAAREVLGKTKRQSKTTAAWIVSMLILLVVGAVLAATYYNNEPQQTITVKAEEVLTPLEPPLDSLQWTSDLPIEKSKETAYQSLIEQWGLVYNPKENGSACDFALTHNLQCKFRQGNMNSLIFLDRPAVLKLYDNEAHPFYVTLTEITGKTASIIIGTEILTVPISEIESMWFGHYTLLWKTPPEYRGDMIPGRPNNSVPWLIKQLSLIRGEIENPVENLIYNDELVLKVKEFQTDEGLSPDGIVGMLTIIRINTAVEKDLPRLIDAQEEI